MFEDELILVGEEYAADVLAAVKERLVFLEWLFSAADSLQSSIPWSMAGWERVRSHASMLAKHSFCQLTSSKSAAMRAIVAAFSSINFLAMRARQQASEADTHGGLDGWWLFILLVVGRLRTERGGDSSGCRTSVGWTWSSTKRWWDRNRLSFSPRVIDHERDGVFLVLRVEGLFNDEFINEPSMSPGFNNEPWVRDEVDTVEGAV